MSQPKILYSIHKNRIIIRLNQGNNTVESRDLIQTKTKEALLTLLEIEPEARELPLQQDKTGKLNLLIYVVPYASVNAFDVELDIHPEFERKDKKEEKTDIDELEMLLSGMDIGPQGGGYRKSNKSSKSKKYKTTKNKKNKKSTKHKKTKKTKKNKKTHR